MSVVPARPLHVVQVGYDDSVFQKNAPSDTLHRQAWYGQELERQRPGSRISLLVITLNKSATRFAQDNVEFVPVHVVSRFDPSRLFRHLVTLHNEQSIDVIATQTIHQDAWAALLFGKRTGVRVVGQVHYDIFSPFARREVIGGGFFGWFRFHLSMRLARRLYAIRVVSQRTRQTMLARKLHDNVHVVPVPVTMEASNCQSAPDGVSRERVLFVGRLVPAKNLEDWLLVCRRVVEQDPAAEFEIVGDGPLRRDLESKARSLDISSRVHFRGAVPYNDLSSFYTSASAFLLTSRYEGFGRVLVESYLHCLPAVAPRIAGVEDIIEDGTTGFLHQSGDIEGMASSVVRLLQNAQLRQEMGQAGQHLVRSRFDPQELRRRWISLLVSAAEAGRP